MAASPDSLEPTASAPTSPAADAPVPVPRTPDAPATPAPPAAGATDDGAALARAAADRIRRAAGVDRVAAAVVLGSGWGAAASRLGETLVTLDAGDVPGFHPSGVPGHAGTLAVSRLADGRVLLQIAARTHLYEGRGVDAVVHGVRTAAALGARTLVLTNGCGSTTPRLRPGTPVLIADHINLTGISPLCGPRFVSMSDAYAPRLRALAREVRPELPEGVYAQFRGPQYETPAEVRMARALGADLVGMSTALETVAARALGLDVLGLSLVTNAAAGCAPAEDASGEAAPLSHAEVLAAGRNAAPMLAELLADLMEKIA